MSFLSQLVLGYYAMNNQITSTLILLLWLSAFTVTCLQFPEDGRRSPSPATLESARVAVHPAHNAEEEARIFHQHGIKKKKKKKLKRRLLQCLLQSHFQSHLHSRQAPPPVDAQGRFIFLNLYDIDINTNSNSDYDNNDDNSYNDNELCGGGGGDHDHSDDTGFGQGINNLGSLVSNNPLGGSLIPSDLVKPVYENPEKFIRKYVIKPLYRTFRPLYRLL